MRLGLARRCIAVLSAVLTFGLIGASPAAEPGRTYPVGIKQVEFADAHYGPRTLSMAVFYPAAIDESSAKPFVMPFFTKLALYKDAEIAFDGEKRPLVMLSHGRGSTGLSYAWFAQTLASHGYIVAAPYHWRANSYDSTVAYLANKLLAAPAPSRSTESPATIRSSCSSTRRLPCRNSRSAGACSRSRLG